MSAGSAASGGSGVYFFLSYAHAHQPPRRDDPPDRPVRDFYRDLSAEVARIAGLPQGTPVGFADWEISNGSDWRHRLGEVLGTCAVFVPLYAPEYFKSRICGEEWGAFRRRELMHNAQTRREKAAIVPVMWRRVENAPIPYAARRIHYQLPEAGELYRRRAMRELVVRTNRDDLRQAYKDALTAFAKRIVDVARTDPLRTVPDGVPLSADEDAFDGEPDREDWRPLRFVVVAPVKGRLPARANPELYGNSPEMWRPYRPLDETPIAQTAIRLSESDGFHPIIEYLGDCLDLRDGAEPSAPTVLIVDPWSTQDAELVEMLRAFDEISHGKPWVRLMIPWGDKNGSGDGVQVQELEKGLHLALNRMRSQCRLKHPQAVAGLDTVAAFGERLPGVMAAAERGYLRVTRTAYPPGQDGGRGVPRLGGPPPANGPADGQDFRGRGLR